MPRTTLSPTNTTAHGVVIANAAAVDAANGNQFINPNGRCIIEISNGSTVNMNVTFTPFTPRAVSSTVNYTIANDVQVIQNATSKVFGPFDKSLMNDANSMVYVDFSSANSVTARVIEMGMA